MPSTDPVARIAPIEPPYSDETAAQLARWMGPATDADPLKLFRVLVVHEQLAGRMHPLGSGILGPKALVEPRERELMIHRTTALAGAEYEWGVHAAIFGPLVALTDEQLDATVHGTPDDACWSPRERLVLKLADELFHTSTISDELWAQLDGRWTPQQLIELIATAGWYRTISYLANGLRVELEPWARRFA